MVFSKSGPKNRKPVYYSMEIRKNGVGKIVTSGGSVFYAMPGCEHWVVDPSSGECRYGCTKEKRSFLGRERADRVERNSDHAES